MYVGVARYVGVVQRGTLHMCDTWGVTHGVCHVGCVTWGVVQEGNFRDVSLINDIAGILCGWLPESHARSSTTNVPVSSPKC